MMRQLTIPAATIFLYMALLTPPARCDPPKQSVEQINETGLVEPPAQRVERLQLVHEDSYSGPQGASLSFSPDGRTLASGTAHDGTVRLWDVTTGDEICRLSAAPGDSDYPALYPITFSPDGRFVATGGTRIVLWSLMGVRLKTFDDIDQPCYSLAISPDGNTVASCENQSVVTLWDVATGKVLRRIKCASDVMVASYSRQATILVVDESATLRELASGRIRRRGGWSLLEQGSPYSDDGGIYLQATSQRQGVTFRLLDAATGREIRQFAGHRGRRERIVNVAVSRDGRRFACADNRGQISIWSANADK